MTCIAHILPPVAALGLGIAASRGAPVQAQAHAVSPAGGISGQVVNQQSHLPVSGARVNLIGTRLGTATDSAGRFNQASLDAGTYILEVRAIGYGVTSWVLRLRKGEAVDHVIELEPTGVALEPTAVEARRRYVHRGMQGFAAR